MGQKVNPTGLRVGIIRDWEAKWYAEKDFAAYLNEDLRIRKYIEKRLLRHLYQLLRLNGLQTASISQFTLPSQVWLLVRVVQKSKISVRN